MRLNRRLAPTFVVCNLPPTFNRAGVRPNRRRRMAVDGKWMLKIKTPMGEQSGTLDLKADGSALTGTMSGNMGAVTIENGSVAGDAVKWSAKVTSPMPITLEFDGKVEGDALNGSVKLGAFGTSTFSGARA
jgi:hypothetical protein